MSPQGGGLLLEEALRVACQMGRADIELVAPAIKTLATELTRLDQTVMDFAPNTVKTTVAVGENAGIQDALVSLDWLYVHYRQASDRHHAAEAEKVRLVSGQS